MNEIEKYFQNYLIVEVEDDTGLIPSADYGQYVTNYTTPSGDPEVKWRIFYADEENVYLIADDYIHYDYTPKLENFTLLDNDDNGYRLSFNNSGTIHNEYGFFVGLSDITDSRITKWLSYINYDPSADYESMSAISFMLDIEKWSSLYANTEYAEYAVGGPTLDLLCASYKKTHPYKYIEYISDNIGYLVKWSTSSENYNYEISQIDDSNKLYYLKDDISKCNNMWLASPADYGTISLKGLDSSGNLKEIGYTNNNTGFRPIVCLKADAKLEKQVDGTYLLK